jgi:hypothetical protein
MYKLYRTSPEIPQPNAVMTVGEGPCKSFLFDPANTDYQQYLAWLAEGNEPLPADAPTE